MKKDIFTNTILLLVTLIFSGCGGGGGSRGGPDITQPTPTQHGGNPPAVPPLTPVHDFNKCYHKVSWRPATECYGGVPGLKELSDYVDDLFTSGTRSDSDKAKLLIIETSNDVHREQVTFVAELHNNGVGGTISVTVASNGGLASDALLRGDYGNPDIISRSASLCIGAQVSNCWDQDLFNDPDEPIILISAGNTAGKTPLDDMLNGGFSATSLAAVFDNDGKGHWLFVYGLNPEGDDIYPRSSSCHDLIKDYCIGAPYFVGAGTGTVDANGVREYRGYGSGTSFSAPIVAVALKLLLEADPTIAKTSLIRIACVSATDLGPTGNDATYGCGAFNLVKLFDQFGTFVGVAAFPGSSPSTSFNTAVVDPNTNYPSTDLLQDGGSKGQKFAFSYDRETDSASICMKFLCVFYSDEDKSLQKGLLFSTENAYAGVFAEKKDNDFFGGSGSKGSRSDYNEVDYIKGSAGWETELEPYDISIRFDIAKGSAEGGGRIDHLDGIQNKFAITAARSFGYNSNVSFSAGFSNFKGSAGISGSDHDLGHNDFEVGLQYQINF